jgi:hypothetical protein
MVEILEQSTKTCIVVRFGGMIKGEEYRVFLDAVDERLAANERINLVADVSELEFYGDLAAAKDDFGFGVKEYRKVHRAAFVGDQKWIELFIKISGPFYHAEEKHFPAGQLDEAFAWAIA